MGYVHDTQMSQVIPLQAMSFTVGTFTLTNTAHVWSMVKTPADNTSVIHIPITPPQNSGINKGSRLESIDLFWVNGAADLEGFTVEIYRAILPAHAAAMAAPELLLHTPDADHFLPVAPLTQDEHKMTLTLDEPIWLDDDAVIFVELTIDAAVASTFELLPARANFTLRL